MAAPLPGATSRNPPSPSRTNSKTVTDTLVGEHSHHIVGYSLIKGIGRKEVCCVHVCACVRACVRACVHV